MKNMVGSVATVALALLLAVGVALAVGTETARAAFPGVNGRIVFYEENRLEPQDNGIRLINPDGTGARTLVRLPTTSNLRDTGPVFSPSGKRVAYAAVPSDAREGRDAEIYTIDVATRRVTRITDNDLPDGNPTWKPDGARIAFEQERAQASGREDTDIFVKRSDGTGPTVNKTSTPGVDEYSPAWSPGGTEMAFHTGQDGDIVLLNLETGERRDLTSDGTTNYDSSPNWSPDGERIVYASNAPYPQDEGSTDYFIRTMRASDGSDRRTLAQGFVSLNWSGTSYDAPAYSPDGRHIVYARYPQDYVYVRPQLFTMRASDGSNKRLLYNAYFSGGGYPFTEDVYLGSPDWGSRPAR